MDDQKASFPEEKVKIARGRTVTMKPLSLKDLLSMSEQMVKITNLLVASGGAAVAIPLAMKEILEMLPFALVDAELDDIPMEAFPLLVSKFLEQNITERFTEHFLSLLRTIRTTATMLAERIGDLGGDSGPSPEN